MTRPPRFRISTEGDAGILTVGIEGELDLATTPQLQAELDRIVALDGLRRVVLDLRRLAFLDSTGLEAIVRLHKSADGFDVAIVRGPRAVERLFEVMQLDRTLRIVNDPAELAG